VIGGVDYTISFGLSMLGGPSVFLARVAGPPGSKVYQLLDHAVDPDARVQRTCTRSIAIPAGVTAVTLSFAGQGVRTISSFVGMWDKIDRGRALMQ
jgi:hypothetical protein